MIAFKGKLLCLLITVCSFLTVVSKENPIGRVVLKVGSAVYKLILLDENDKTIDFSIVNKSSV
jgi:hypothetical protein